MTLINIILFFVYLYGIGYNFTRFLKHHTIENTIIRVGIGLGAFPVLGILLNKLSLPLDWRIFFILSISFLLYDFIRYPPRIKETSKLKLNKDTILLLVIFFISVFIYCTGPFQYPYLENEDPLTHAAGIKYIAIEKNVNVPCGEFQYINPYPPGYDLIFGILHQTSPSLYWTMKFFNGLIISLGFLFFYFFVREFTRNEAKVLLSTFFLAAIPCYLSHFIWAHSLAVTLFFPAFYCVLKCRDDKRFILPTGIVMAGIFLIQPTQSIKLCLMVFLLFIIIAIVNKKLIINKNCSCGENNIGNSTFFFKLCFRLHNIIRRAGNDLRGILQI